MIEGHQNRAIRTHQLPIKFADALRWQIPTVYNWTITILTVERSSKTFILWMHTTNSFIIVVKSLVPGKAFPWGRRRKENLVECCSLPRVQIRTLGGITTLVDTLLSMITPYPSALMITWQLLHVCLARRESHNKPPNVHLPTTKLFPKIS